MKLADMQAEVHRAKATGIVDLIVAAAKAHGLDPAFALAIGSRENDLVNSLGDANHAVGVMQVDRRFWPEAQQAYDDDSWETNPAALIGLGCQILADNLAWAQKTYPSYTEDQWYKIAAAAYNAGTGGATNGIEIGDCDKFTTGANYGADVCQRMALLKQLGV